MEVGRAAVPYSNLRGAIGTFHAGKSADPSRKVSLPGHLLHREDLRRCPSNHRTEEARQFLQEGDATTELSYQDTDAACYTTLLPGHLLHREDLRRCPSTHRTGKARQFLQKGDATKELSYQDRDAARSTTSRTEKPARFSSKVTPHRSSHTRTETQFALLPLALRSLSDSPAR